MMARRLERPRTGVDATGPDEPPGVMDRVATLGSWFAVSPGDDGPAAWELATTVCRSGGRIDELIGDCAARYGTDNRLVGVSFLLKSYTARIAFPAIACHVTQRQVPDVSLGNVALRFSAGRATGVMLRSPSLCVEEVDSLHTLHRILVDHLAALITALQERSTGRPGWLWSIAADACASAFVNLPAHAATPERVRSDADALLTFPGSPLAGRGRLTQRDGRLVYERGSCCLYFMVPQGMYCDNCSVKPSRRRASKAG